MELPENFKQLSDILQNKADDKILLKCDFDQKPLCSPSVLRDSVFYIVAAVVVNDDGEVLLIQEAKKSCHGLWYLPAGRVEPNETFVEAVKRECVEEAGLNFEPEGLVCIELNSGGRWIRLTFTGKITGGELKTTDQADSESLQANWFKSTDNVKLRCRDILALISRTREYKHEVACGKRSQVLPVEQPHAITAVRLICVQEINGKLFLCLQKKEVGGNTIFSLPTVCFALFHTDIDKPVEDYLRLHTDKNISFTSLGVLNIEHSSHSGKDGSVFNLVVSLKNQQSSQLLQFKQGSSLDWFVVPSSSPLYKFACINSDQQLLVPVVSLNKY